MTNLNPNNYTGTYFTTNYTICKIVPSPNCNTEYVGITDITGRHGNFIAPWHVKQVAKLFEDGTWIKISEDKAIMLKDFVRY